MMGPENRVYSNGYFESLGFPPEAADELTKNWNPNQPERTYAENREAILAERELREHTMQDIFPIKEEN